MFLNLRFFAVFITVLLVAEGVLISSSRAYAQQDTVQGGQPLPVDFQADSLIHDDENQIIRAEGNVEFVQGLRVLRADSVVYDLSENEVTARGQVILTDPNGDVHFADEVVLDTNMTAGLVKGLQSYLSGGGVLNADRGERLTDKIIKLYDASYTPCDCDIDSAGNPVWQIKANEVTYNEDEHRVSYKDAKFELFGVPVFYTPIMSHPDNKLKQKSGLLTPSFGYNSDLGAHIQQSYYWAIAPDKDLTVGVLASSNDEPVALAEYRQRFEKASLQLNTSLTHSSRTDDINGQQVFVDNEWRGHLFAEGRWDINEKWRSGLDIQYASDDQYLRQYDFKRSDVLENELYVERFSERNYAAGRLLAFQDVRIRERQTDQPNVLPEIEASFQGDPNATLGGHWTVDASVLGIQRSDGQDVSRLVGAAGWERRMVTGFGLVTEVETNVRGDMYYTSDRDIATGGSGRSGDGTESRFFPQAHLTTSYPLVNHYEKVQAVVEPIVALTVAPNLEDDNSDIPNEDSQDVQLDASNLFEANRFPGLDSIEDRSRVTYGLRTGLFDYDGSFVRFFMGQSYRFDEEGNPFPQGSGLSEQESDYVGQVTAMYDDRFGVDYKFQLASDTLSSQRHEFDGYLDLDEWQFDTRYLYATALEGTDLDESREQIRTAAAYDMTNEWRARTDVLYDLGENQGLREAAFGFDYTGCCMSFSATMRRNITFESSGESGTEIMFRFGLKGIGEYGHDGGDLWRAGNR
ncbi:MAG: LPS assembly protein LptD [Alphaproteobacteria bacterium]|jgi:LPS-assembly protein|nr:LPS assembly protein LptD [Alphaproteobacteria bacterium]MDP7222778.1 LPS assembly protein LptD [Alphaproteobacteria bacterium]